MSTGTTFERSGHNKVAAVASTTGTHEPALSRWRPVDGPPPNVCKRSPELLKFSRSGLLSSIGVFFNDTNLNSGIGNEGKCGKLKDAKNSGERNQFSSRWRRSGTQVVRWILASMLWPHFIQPLGPKGHVFRQISVLLTVKCATGDAPKLCNRASGSQWQWFLLSRQKIKIVGVHNYYENFLHFTFEWKNWTDKYPWYFNWLREEVDEIEKYFFSGSQKFNSSITEGNHQN